MVEVILPVLDEAAALPWVLGRFPADCEPLVVDNGSSDGSAEIAHGSAHALCTSGGLVSARPAGAGS